jgi:hypothetical protein
MLVWRMFHTLLIWMVMADEMAKADRVPVMLVWRMFHTLLNWTVIRELSMRNAPYPPPDDVIMLVLRMFHTLLIWMVMEEL